MANENSDREHEFELLALLPHEDERNTRSGRHKYSVGDILRTVGDTARDDNKPPRAVPSGLIGEVHQELQKRQAKPARGVLIPSNAIWPTGETRDGVVTTSNAAGAVATQRAGRFVDSLRRRMVLGALGSPVMNFAPARNGRVQLTKRLTSAGVSWCAEGVAPSATNLTTSAVVFSPKFVAARTTVSRTMLASAGDPNFDLWILNDIVTSLAGEVDRVGLNGYDPIDAPTGEPTGLLHAADLPVVSLGTDGAALTRANLLGFERTVGNQNADNSPLSRLGFVTNPDVRAKLRTLENSAGSGRYAWGDDDRIIGKPAFATASVPNNLTKGEDGTGLSAIAFGDFTQLGVNIFGAVDLLVDHFKQSHDGTVHLSAFLDVDVQVFQIKSFIAALDVLTS